jgi:hypothetical protein
MVYVFDPSKPIALGADHAGVAYKKEVIEWLEKKGYQVKDFGTYTTDSVDYPDFAHPTATSEICLEGSKTYAISIYFKLLLTYSHHYYSHSSSAFFTDL